MTEEMKAAVIEELGELDREVARAGVPSSRA